MERKQEYFTRLIKYLDTYEKIYLVRADNVGSSHMQRIRIALRGLGAWLLMGKNTMIRKAIRGHLANNPKLEDLLPHIKGNMGFIFFNGDNTPIKNLVEENRVSAAAKAGSYAPNDVTIPAGLTGLEPTMTGFLQALAIQSKITKGQIELTNDVHLIKTGHRVGASEATLLSKLNIKPFRYGLIPFGLYHDGSVITADYLNITDSDILEKFKAVTNNVTALSLGLDFPTFVSVPHLIIKGYKELLAIGLATDYKFKQVEELSKRAASAPAPVANTPAPAKANTPAPAPVAKAPEPAPKSESDADMMDLFG